MKYPILHTEINPKMFRNRDRNLMSEQKKENKNVKLF